tara:strand:+ start:4323 stop:5141 length:819 start_codon:yes stop_codon:yes gene_type:complete
MAVHIFCALSCEAKPIIDNFNLIRLNEFDLFKIYQSIDKETSLIITNIGKVNAVEAVTYHHDNIKTSEYDIWLNIGIAGHENISIGEIRIINKIVDHEDQSCWYPQIIFNPPCNCIDLITLGKPSTEYQSCLYDMEASGFYFAATKYGTLELIHSLKIISDNNKAPISKINKNDVSNLVKNKISTINKILNELRLLSSEIKSTNKQPRDYENFLKKWHFSQTEKYQLLNLLQKHDVRFPENNFSEISETLKTGKQVLKKLRDKLNKMDFSLH